MIRGFLQRAFTWRNILRASGLGAMLWLILTKQHPDATALLACGAMMGLPSFIVLQPLLGGRDESEKREKV